MLAGGANVDGQSAFSIQGEQGQGITFDDPVRGVEGWLERYSVRVGAPGMSASKVVDVFLHDHSPALFFEGLAASWRGWNGTRCWSGTDSGYELTATMDRSGHVTLTATVWPKPENLPSCEATVSINVESEQLDRIRDDAKVFFGEGETRE